MSVLKALLIALIIAVEVCVVPSRSRAAGPATTQAVGAMPDLETSWANLAKNEPDSVRIRG
jgi:hypothetical protein